VDSTTLYQHYYPVIYQQVLDHIRHREEAEDLTHNTFIKALRALDRAPAAPEEVRRWLGRIAKNTVIDHVRRARLVSWSALSEVSQVTPSDLPETIARRMEVQTVLHALPTPTRQLLLAWVEGYTVAELAIFLGISPQAAQLRLFRARQQFKHHYLASHRSQHAEEVFHG